MRVQVALFKAKRKDRDGEKLDGVIGEVFGSAEVLIC